MSVSIRLTRIGKKYAPSYRVVVVNTRSKRDGKYIDLLGFYNPSDTSTKFTYDKKKFKGWVEKGALISDAVQKLIDGKYEYKKYEPSKEVKKVEKSSEK